MQQPNIPICLQMDTGIENVLIEDIKNPFSECYTIKKIPQGFKDRRKTERILWTFPIAFSKS